MWAVVVEVGCADGGQRRVRVIARGGVVLGLLDRRRGRRAVEEVRVDVVCGCVLLCSQLSVETRIRHCEASSGIPSVM